MTDNNMDQFDDELDLEEEEFDGKKSSAAKQNLVDAWKSQPIFKLMVIMGVVGIAAAGALGLFSGDPTIDDSQLVRPPSLDEAPGAQASPYFIEQTKQASAQRAQEALDRGGSAMPTPIGENMDLSAFEKEKENAQLMEFRAEAERLRQEMRREQKQTVQKLERKIQRQAPEKVDDTLAQAMQRQMGQLMESWTPQGMKVVQGQKDERMVEAEQAKIAFEKTMATAAAAAPLDFRAAVAAEKALIAAGTVNYAQLLTEANSDVKSPILAQILSGPLAGARAIGRFQVSGDYLILEFSLATRDGKDYPIQALALDPDTTLSGMATEVDHRYFTRVILPAASAFVSTFGSSLGNTSTSSTVSDGVVITEQANQSAEDAIYAGIGQMGQTIGQFFQNEANQTKPLVRVGVGTPLGLFFLTSVKDPQGQGQLQNQGVPVDQSLLATGYQSQGVIVPQNSAAATQETSVPYPNASAAAVPSGVVKNLTSQKALPSNISIGQ